MKRRTEALENRRKRFFTPSPRRRFSGSAPPLRGKRVLITAGPTREYWDPVRFITNASSGAMGIALAKEARRLGAKVTLVLGPTGKFLVSSSGFRVEHEKFFSELGTRNSKLTIVPIVSAWEMYQAVKQHLRNTDIFIGAAAVVDYRPAQPSRLKIKRRRPSMILRLYGNPDIVAMVGHLKKDRPASVIGFALETDHLLERAREKLFRKRMDWIVANRESNMGQSNGAVTLLSRWGDHIPLGNMSKTKLAKKIWGTLLAHG